MVELGVNIFDNHDDECVELLLDLFYISNLYTLYKIILKHSQVHKKTYLCSNIRGINPYKSFIELENYS